MVIPTKDKKARYSAMATVGDKHIYLGVQEVRLTGLPPFIH